MLLFQNPYPGYHGLLQNQPGYDNVGYDDRPAVYYPNQEIEKETLYRGTVMEQPTYKSKINYQKADKHPEKNNRVKKQIKIQPPTPTTFGRRYIPLKYRNQNVEKVIDSKIPWKNFAKDTQKNRSLSGGVNDIEATISTFNNQLEVSNLDDNNSPVDDISDLTKNSPHGPKTRINANDYKKRLDDFQVSLDLAEPDFVRNTRLKAELPINKFINARKGNLKYTTIDDFWQSTHATNIEETFQSRFGNKYRTALTTTKATPTKAYKDIKSNLDKKITQKQFKEKNKNEEKSETHNEVRRNFVSSSFDWDEDYGNYDYTHGTSMNNNNNYNYYDYEYTALGDLQEKADNAGTKSSKVEQDLMKIEEFDSIFKSVPKNMNQFGGYSSANKKLKSNSEKNDPNHMIGDKTMELKISQEKEYENGLRVWKVDQEKNNQKSDFPSFSSASFNTKDNGFNMGNNNKFFGPNANSNHYENFSNGKGFMRQSPAEKMQISAEPQKSLKPFGSEMEDYFSKTSGLDKVQEAYQNLKHSMSFESKKVPKKKSEYKEDLMARSIESRSPIEKLKLMVEEKSGEVPREKVINQKTKINQGVEKRYLRSQSSNIETNDEIEKDNWVPKYPKFADVIKAGSKTKDIGSSETKTLKKRKYPLVKHTTYAHHYAPESVNIVSRKSNKLTSSDNLKQNEPKFGIDDGLRVDEMKKKEFNFYEPMNKVGYVEPKSSREFAQKSISKSNGFMNNIPSFGIDDGLGVEDYEENEFEYYDTIDEYDTEPTSFPRFGDFMKLNSQDAGKVSSFMEDFLKISPNNQNGNSVSDVQVFSTIHPNIDLEQQVIKPSKIPQQFHGTTRPSKRPLPRPDPLPPRPTPTFNYSPSQFEENKVVSRDTNPNEMHVKSEVKHPPPSWKDLAADKKKNINPFASLRKEVKSLLNKSKKTPPLLPKLPPVPSPTPPTKREIWRHQFKQKIPHNLGSNIKEVEAPNLWPKSTPVTSDKNLSPFEKGFPPKNDIIFNQFKNIEQPSINDAKQNDESDFTVPTPTFQTQLAQFAPDKDFFSLPSNFPKNSLNVNMNTDAKLGPPHNDLTNHLLSKRPRGNSQNFQQKLKPILKWEKHKKSQQKPGFSLPILKRPKPTKMNPAKRQPNKIRLKKKQNASNKVPKSSKKQNAKKRPFRLNLPKMPGFPQLPKLPPMPTMPSLSKEKGKRPKGYKAYGAAPTGFIDFTDLNIPLVPSLPSLDEMQDALFNSPSIADKAVQGYSGLLEDVMSTFGGSSNRRSSDIGSHSDMLQFVPMGSEKSYTIERILERDEKIDKSSDTKEVNRKGKPSILLAVNRQGQSLNKRTIELDSHESDGDEETLAPTEKTSSNNGLGGNKSLGEKKSNDVPEKSGNESLKNIVSSIRKKILKDTNEQLNQKLNFDETSTKENFSNGTKDELKSVNIQPSENKFLSSQISIDRVKGILPKHDPQKYKIHSEYTHQRMETGQFDKSIPKSRLAFNYNADSKSKLVTVRNDKSHRRTDGVKKFGKYSKLPKNFGYKKWGLRLPSKMLSVSKVSRRRPRKSEIDLSKKASQERYKIFLKRKFKLEGGGKDRMKIEPNSEQNKKAMQKGLGNPTTNINVDAISKGPKKDDYEFSNSGDSEIIEPLPTPKELVMEEEKEENMILRSSIDELSAPKKSESSINSNDEVVKNQKQPNSKQNYSSSQLSVQDRIEKLLSKSIFSSND